jgi:hypothetical protein
MNRQFQATLLTGFGIGAGLMYFLDPASGARRRALIRDRAVRTANQTGDALETISRDLASQTTGTLARVRSTFDRQPVDDRILVERVRARLGRLVSHPHALEVSVLDGVVVVRGPILQAEMPRLLSGIERVRGVREVINELEPHEEAGNIPALQGGSAPSGGQPEAWQRTWSPTTRAIAGVTATALAGYGASRRDLPGVLVAATGLGLLTRAARN